MSTATETNDQAVHEDALGMSDEAFASMDPSAFEIPDESAAEEGTGFFGDELTNTVDDDDQGSDAEDDSATAEADDGQEETGESEDTDDEDTDTTEDDDAEEEETSEGEDDEEGDGDTEEDSDEESEDDGDQENEDEDTEESDSEVDYKAEYERLMAPFKANGKEMKVDNVDEAIQLMQMGANYNKKMAALKPSLRTLKTLEKNDLLGPEKLNHLIDLSKGDKGAIQKLLKDSGIDPLDFDTNEESDYTPNSHTVDDRELALDETLESLQESETYAQTVNAVNGWDEQSQTYVANNPQLLQVIDSHMATGIYERVSSAVEKERTFGRLSGLSDLEAYKQVGDRLNEQGAFNDLVQQNQRQEEKAPAAKKVVARKKPKTPDPKVKQKKRAASSTRTKPANSQSADDLNPLSMSDEEFERQVNENLL